MTQPSFEKEVVPNAGADNRDSSGRHAVTGAAHPTNAGVAMPEPPRRIRARAVEPEPVEIDDTPADSDFETPPANGPYRGTVPVRTLERGIGGEEMRLELAKRLVPGAIWRRGAQRVRIEKLTGYKVHCRELSNGSARRIFDRGVFLSSSHPERP